MLYRRHVFKYLSVGSERKGVRLTAIAQEFSRYCLSYAAVMLIILRLIPPRSYNPFFSDGMIWITGVDSNVLAVVDALSGDVLASLPVGPKPRFLTAGEGSVWTLNQGDGTVSRVDTSTRKATATIPVGIPGVGGEICYGADSLWATAFDIPFTRIDAKTNKVLRQWVGRGGDALSFGHESIWLTDYYRG